MLTGPLLVGPEWMSLPSSKGRMARQSLHRRAKLCAPASDWSSCSAGASCWRRSKRSRAAAGATVNPWGRTAAAARQKHPTPQFTPAWRVPFRMLTKSIGSRVGVPMSCCDCEATQKQYLDMRRIAAQLALALDRQRRWFRFKSNDSPSLTELVALVERRRHVIGRKEISPALPSIAGRRWLFERLALHGGSHPATG